MKFTCNQVTVGQVMNSLVKFHFPNAGTGLMSESSNSQKYYLSHLSSLDLCEGTVNISSWSQKSNTYLSIYLPLTSMQWTLMLVLTNTNVTSVTLTKLVLQQKNGLLRQEGDEVWYDFIWTGTVHDNTLAYRQSQNERCLWQVTAEADFHL